MINREDYVVIDLLKQKLKDLLFDKNEISAFFIEAGTIILVHESGHEIKVTNDLDEILEQLT